MPLLNRNNHPPGGGFTFVQPETHWRLPGGLPFRDAVQAIVKHRIANPSFKLAIESAVVADELDEFTCLRLSNDPRWCAQKKTNQALDLELPSKPVERRSVAVADRINELRVGVDTLTSWLGTGMRPIEPHEAESRASICAGPVSGSKCPKNVMGSFLDRVTGVIGESIHSAMEAKAGLELRTSFDDRLGTCDACGCHLSLKVWAPAEHIKDNLTPEVSENLDPQCWILRL